MSLGANVYQFLLGLGLCDWGGDFWVRKGDEIPPYLVWILPLSSICASVQYRQEYDTKRVNHPRVYLMLYAMPYVHLNPDHNNRTKYSILELKLTRA